MRSKILDRLLMLALTSNFIEGEKPINLILVADAGEGKTFALRGIEANFMKEVSNFSERGLKNFIAYNPHLRVLQITDFSGILENRSQMRMRSLNLLNSLIEEGLAEDIVFRANSIIENFRCISLITSMTTESYRQKQRDLENIGFYSRCFIYPFKFAEEFKQKLQKDILNESFHKIEMPEMDIKKIGISEELKNGLEKIADRLIFPNRTFRMLKTFCLSSAYLDNRDVAGIKDLESVMFYFKGQGGQKKQEIINE